MTADHLLDIDQFNADLWKMADELRANSGLASNEFSMPNKGLLFLRHAMNRHYEARTALEADKAAADFRRRRAMMLPKAARYDVILEQRFSPLAGQFPKITRASKMIFSRWMDDRH